MFPFESEVHAPKLVHGKVVQFIVVGFVLDRIDGKTQSVFANQVEQCQIFCVLELTKAVQHRLTKEGPCTYDMQQGDA